MLSVLAIGHLKFDQIAPLQPLFSRIELIDSQLPRDTLPQSHAAEINRMLAGAANPWVLILREREFVDSVLSDEIRGALSDQPQAWGFRIRVQPEYDGEVLRLGPTQADVRLVHQRHARLKEGDWKIEGSVVRLKQPLRRITFETSAEHAAWLKSNGVPHSALRRMLLFTRNAILTGAWWRSRVTLRYLWLEAGYDLK